MPLEEFPAVVTTNKTYFTPLRPTELMQSLCFLHNAGKMPPPPCSGRTKLTCEKNMIGKAGLGHYFAGALKGHVEYTQDAMK